MKGFAATDAYLLVMYDKMLYFKSHYIYPSQETILKWMRTRGGLEMSRRTLNRHFKKLCNSQIFGRIRRIKHHPGRGLEFNTTLYTIGFLGLLRLVQIGKMTYAELRAWIKNSAPFRKRQPKKPKKGLTPADTDFYPDAHSLGGIVPDLI